MTDSATSAWMCALLTPVESMLCVYLRTRDPSVPVLPAPDLILCQRWPAPPSTPAATTRVTDQPSVDPQPLASAVSAPRVRLVTHTRLAASLKVPVPMVTETVLTSHCVSLVGVRMSAMTRVDPTLSAASATDKQCVSVWLDSSPVLWTPGPASETVSSAEETMTALVAAPVRLVSVDTPAEVRMIVWWGSSAVTACA